MTTRTDGPFITGAFFVERVLTEQDGTNTYMRVIDRVTVAASGEGPDDLPPLQLNLTLIMLLRAGAARGRHDLYVRPEKPSGEQMPEHRQPINFEPSDEAGVNIHLNMDFGIDQEGTYWFDVMLGPTRQLLTRTPLRLIYQPTV